MTNTIHLINPATGSVSASLVADTAATVATKYQRARAAQPAWFAVPLGDKLSVIKRFRALVVEQLEALALTLTLDTGKPIAQARNELNGLLPRIDFFLANTQEAIASEQVMNDAGMCEQISHQPLGVIGNISAWNYPWFVGANVFIPALLTGNAILYKPSEFALQTGLHIERLLHAAGVPADIFITLVGAGDVGTALLDQALDGLFFTGSHATGQAIATKLAPRLIKMQLELGGKDPSYVRADADAKTAAESLADGAMYNTGQSCCSVERIYVHESVYDVFIEQFLKTVKGFTLGDPLKDSTYIGAITRAPQLAVLEEQVRDALAKGATLRCGGKRLPGPGNWFEPTVLTEVDHSMLVMREESFGPIIGIQKVTDDAQALSLMNDTRYGLTAGIYSKDESASRALMGKLNAGSVYWNCCDRVSPRLPWSGHGDSGLGLTLSSYGIQTFTRPKAWHLRQPA